MPWPSCNIRLYSGMSFEKRKEKRETNDHFTENIEITDIYNID